MSRSFEQPVLPSRTAEMKVRAILLSSVIATLGCSSAGLLYPGDELRESPSGYGLVVIGAAPAVRLYTLDVCDRRSSCVTIGPFMRPQDAYVIRLPVGEQCLTQVEVEVTGDIEGGGSGMHYRLQSNDDCFRVIEGGLSYIGSFYPAKGYLRVVHRPDIRELVLAHYPGLDAAKMDVQTSVD